MLITGPCLATLSSDSTSIAAYITLHCMHYGPHYIAWHTLQPLKHTLQPPRHTLHQPLKGRRTKSRSFQGKDPSRKRSPSCYLERGITSSKEYITSSRAYITASKAYITSAFKGPLNKIQVISRWGALKEKILLLLSGARHLFAFLQFCNFHSKLLCPAKSIQKDWQIAQGWAKGSRQKNKRIFFFFTTSLTTKHN